MKKLTLMLMACLATSSQAVNFNDIFGPGQTKYLTWKAKREELKRRISAGTSPNNAIYNLLHKALRQKDYDFIEWLLAKSANPKFTDISGLSALDLVRKKLDAVRRPSDFTEQWFIEFGILHDRFSRPRVSTKKLRLSGPDQELFKAARDGDVMGMKRALDPMKGKMHYEIKDKK